MSDWTRCPYWDCGWCYADESLPTNIRQRGFGNECLGTTECDYYSQLICTDRDPEIDDGKQ